jgi:carbon-monoxide dehydrogenase medium subunit
LVDLRKIPQLRGIRHREGRGGLHIGAMTTFAAIAGDATVNQHYHALGEAAQSIGDPQVRNRGTIGGSLAARISASDLTAAALALDLVINAVGVNGVRAIPAGEFFADQGTGLQPDEIVTDIDVPPALPLTGSAYAKFRNPANAYPICGVAARVTRAPDGTLRDCRVAVTGATTVPIRLHTVEAALQGKIPTPEHIAQAVVPVSEGLTCLSDQAASSEYRLYLIGVLASQAIRQASARTGFH